MRVWYEYTRIGIYPYRYISNYTNIFFIFNYTVPTTGIVYGTTRIIKYKDLALKVSESFKLNVSTSFKRKFQLVTHYLHTHDTQKYVYLLNIGKYIGVH